MSVLYIAAQGLPGNKTQLQKMNLVILRVQVHKLARQGPTERKRKRRRPSVTCVVHLLLLCYCVINNRSAL